MKKQGIILLSAVLVALVSSGCGNQNNSNRTVYAEASAVSFVSQPVSEEALQDTETTVSPEASVEPSADHTESSVPTILESNTQQTSVIEFSLDNNRPFNTIEEYLQTDSAKEMIQQLHETESSGDGVIHTAVFTENGTKLIFERQLSTDFNLWLTDEFLDNVQKNVEAQENVFISLVDSLESCINNKVITVVVRYVDPEGNVLYQREFDNDHLNTNKTSSDEVSRTSEKTSAAETSKAPVQQSSQADGAVSAVSGT